jgi:hypothetical protein
MAKTYFSLCNDILREMYYEEADTFSDLENTIEGRRVKRKLNQINTEITVNEKNIWTFRERTSSMYMVNGINQYPIVNGYIEYIVPVKYPSPLYYNPNWKYLPRPSQGRPIYYRVYNEQIEVFPTPNSGNDGLEYEIKYLTYDCAKDSNGCDKAELVLTDDEPIIPERHRDILVYGVLKDLRASVNDAKSQFFEKRYKELYRAMLSDCNHTNDFPAGLDINTKIPSVQESMLTVFYNPRSGGK